MQSPIDVVAAPERAAALLDPTRMAILELLGEPDSAAGVARELGLPRQRVAYHVRELEKRGLVEHVEDRRKGNCVERVMRAVARRFVIAPQALGALAVDPEDIEDRFSSAYLAAVSARTLGEVAVLREQAEDAGKRLPTLTLESNVRFASPADQQAFARDLAQCFTELAARYHDAESARGRSFRFTVSGYPTPSRSDSSGGTSS